MRIATTEQTTILATAVEPRWEAMVLCAAYGGLRWDELLERCSVLRAVGPCA